MEDTIILYLLAAGMSLIVSVGVFFTFRAQHKVTPMHLLPKQYLGEEGINFTERKDSFVSSFTSRQGNRTGIATGGSICKEII